MERAESIALFSHFFSPIVRAIFRRRIPTKKPAKKLALPKVEGILMIFDSCQEKTLMPKC